MTGLSPTSGPDFGGTSVTITGTNLSGVTDVSFGGVPGMNLTVVSPTTLVVSAPTGTAGAVDVVVTSPGGSATAIGAFSYIVGP
ncbi:IPT/TIG domain-containing protein [Cohnella zeiphila]|uniref:IPT/TIG domain-containing protein n=1 Tax=Cohnella zeiphila TaxID=2761120 RepID=UPI003B586E0E